MDILEESNVPPFVNLHPWAENAWNKCVRLMESAAQAPLVSDNSPAEVPTFPEQCRISEMCVDTLSQLVVSKRLPTFKDFTCCEEVAQKTKYCWDKTMEILEDPNVPTLAHLHPWADNAWDRCISIRNVKILPH
ncbi:hypothetical protein MKX01_026398 [Papaver californicum]|nr:hypothetical protein MKX01_026398 [Papaver californicum]